MIGCLQTCVCKQPIIALYFESENGLKFHNLEAWWWPFQQGFFQHSSNFGKRPLAKIGKKMMDLTAKLEGAHWFSGRVRGPRVQASPASLPCGPWERHIYPSLVLVQPRKTRSCLTERLLMGCKRIKSNKNNNNIEHNKVSQICILKIKLF